MKNVLDMDFFSSATNHLCFALLCDAGAGSSVNHSSALSAAPCGDLPTGGIRDWRRKKEASSSLLAVPLQFLGGILQVTLHSEAVPSCTAAESNFPNIWVFPVLVGAASVRCLRGTATSWEQGLLHQVTQLQLLGAPPPGFYIVIINSFSLLLQL